MFVFRANGICEYAGFAGGNGLGLVTMVCLLFFFFCNSSMISLAKSSSSLADAADFVSGFDLALAEALKNALRISDLGSMFSSLSPWDDVLSLLKCFRVLA